MLRVGFVGAPSSGKTTLSARIFGGILESGFSSVGYVQEYAREWAGQGKPISEFWHQSSISIEQIDREDRANLSGFEILLCDSAIWMGATYLSYRLDTIGKTEHEKLIPEYDKHVQRYMEMVVEPQYDVIVYTPLFSNKNYKNAHRLHDNTQAREIDKLIVNTMTKHTTKSMVITASKDLEIRNRNINKICKKLVNLSKNY